MKLPLLFLIVAASLCSAHAAPPRASRALAPTVPQLDAAGTRLRQKIVGVWLTEELPSLATHIGGRYQYFPDGRFVADYRISRIGGSTTIREVGIWDVAMGAFTETVQQSTRRDNRPTPKLIRRIVTADATRMVLESRTGMRAVLLRARVSLERGPRSLASRDDERLLRDLGTVGMRGFLPVPASGRPREYAWTLESRKIPSNPR